MADFKLRLTSGAWQTYTGVMAGVKFTNGTSDNVVPRPQVNRISAITACDKVDETGTSTGQAGAAAALVNTRGIAAPTDLALETMTPEQLVAERKAAMARMLNNPANKLYTEAELEDIGSKQGIKGVRVIGDAWGVRERSISKLIDLILQAQTEYMGKVKERDDQVKAARDAATAASIKAQQDRQAAVDAQARVLTPDATPNAIGDDGKAVHTDPNVKPAIDPSLKATPNADQTHVPHRFKHGGITVETTDPNPASVAGAAAVADAVATTEAPTVANDTAAVMTTTTTQQAS